MTVTLAPPEAASAPAPAPAAPPAPRGLGSASVAGLVVAVGGLVLGLRPLGDNSFLTHLATGRLILAGGSVPTADPYSFTAPGEPWVVQSWLPSLLYAGLERLGGGHAILLFTGLLTALLAGLAWRLTAPARGLVARTGLAALVLGLGVGFWPERPLLVGLVFMAVVLLAAEGRADPRWLVPALWVWANSHGSFPIALVVLALLAGGRRLDGQRPVAELRALRWAAAGTALAVVNPVGTSLLTFPVQMLRRGELLRGVVEWQSPDFAGVEARLFLVLVVAAVAVLVRRPSWRAALPLLVFLPASLVAARNIPLATLVVLPGLAAGLRGLGSVEGRQRSPRAVVLGAGGLVLAGLVVAGALSRPAFALDDYPQDAVAWMAGEGLLDPSSRVVTVDIAGNYLEAVAGTSVPVFFDDRYDMYPAPLVEDFYALVSAEEGWKAVLDRHRATAVLWPRSRPLAGLVTESPAWRIAYADAGWVVALPR